MATGARRAHRAWMVEIALLLCTGLAFAVLVAAVPVEIDEERREERARRASAREQRL